MKKATQSDYADALRTLDGMEEMARNEMLVQGSYLGETIVNEKLYRQGAICGGQQACFLGTMALANPRTKKVWERLTALFRTRSKDRRLRARTLAAEDRAFFEDDSREDVLARNPSLRLAYEWCEQAAIAKRPEFESRGIEIDPRSFRSQGESLFEGINLPDDLIRKWDDDGYRHAPDYAEYLNGLIVEVIQKARDIALEDQRAFASR